MYKERRACGKMAAENKKYEKIKRQKTGNGDTCGNREEFWHERRGGSPHITRQTTHDRAAKTVCTVGKEVEIELCRRPGMRTRDTIIQDTEPGEISQDTSR